MFEDRFIEKQNQIRNIMSIPEIMSFLDIKPQFQLILNEHTVPYENAIQELDRIQTFNNPREIIRQIQLMHSSMKCSVLLFNNNKFELSAMDDELPVLIYIVLMSSICHNIMKLSLVEDFLTHDTSMESEIRVLTNLRAAVDYIEHEWKL